MANASGYLVSASIGNKAESGSLSLAFSSAEVLEMAMEKSTGR